MSDEQVAKARAVLDAELNPKSIPPTEPSPGRSWWKIFGTITYYSVNTICALFMLGLGWQAWTDYTKEDVVIVAPDSKPEFANLREAADWCNNNEDNTSGVRTFSSLAKRVVLMDCDIAKDGAREVEQQREAEEARIIGILKQDFEQQLTDFQPPHSLSKCTIDFRVGAVKSDLNYLGQHDWYTKRKIYGWRDDQFGQLGKCVDDIVDKNWLALDTLYIDIFPAELDSSEYQPKVYITKRDQIANTATNHLVAHKKQWKEFLSTSGDLGDEIREHVRYLRGVERERLAKEDEEKELRELLRSSKDDDGGFSDAMRGIGNTARGMQKQQREREWEKAKEIEFQVQMNEMRDELNDKSATSEPGEDAGPMGHAKHPGKPDVCNEVPHFEEFNAGRADAEWKKRKTMSREEQKVMDAAKKKKGEARYKKWYDNTSDACRGQWGTPGAKSTPGRGISK